MRVRNAFFATCAGSLMALFLGCGEDELFSATKEPQGGSSPEPSRREVGGEDAPGEVDAAIRRWVLLTKNDTTGSEMAAVNVDTGAVDGRFGDVGRSGVSAAGDLFAFYVSTSRDAVLRLNDTAPWTAGATWNIALGEAGADSAAVEALPNEVLSVSPNKAYVLLGARNQLGVIDPSISGSNTITSFVDLSAYLSPFDSDGNVEALAGYYLGPRKRLYVLLGSVDENQKDLVGTGYVCTKVNARVIAIDVLTNEVVPMSDGGATSVELNGYSQSARDSLVYDPSADRLLIMSRGCNESGVIARRQVEAVNLASGEVTSVLALNDQPTPRSFVRVDSARIAIAFEGVSRMWNPALPSLGDVIPGAPEIFAYDGNENLVGVRTVTGDAGVLGLEVVRTPLPVSDGGGSGGDASDGGSSTSTPVVLQAVPFSTVTGAVSRVQFWSR